MLYSFGCKICSLITWVITLQLWHQHSHLITLVHSKKLPPMKIWQSGSTLKSFRILATWSKKAHCSLLFVGEYKLTRGMEQSWIQTSKMDVTGYVIPLYHFNLDLKLTLNKMRTPLLWLVHAESKKKNILPRSLKIPWSFSVCFLQVKRQNWPFVF